MGRVVCIASFINLRCKNSFVQANKKITRCLKTPQLSIRDHKWQQVPQYVFLTEVDIQKERAMKSGSNQFVYSLYIQQWKTCHREEEHGRPRREHAIPICERHNDGARRGGKQLQGLLVYMNSLATTAIANVIIRKYMYLILNSCSDRIL
jgi:hypothetical protein